MDCPTCGGKIPEGTLECPRCKPLDISNPNPLGPSAERGNMALGIAAGLVVAILGGYGWALYVAFTNDLTAWPAIVIGGLVGLVLRFLGGQPSQVTGLVGAFCGLVGIGGGIVLILLQWEGETEELMNAAEFINLAFIFFGLSMARSLASGKKPKQAGMFEELKKFTR